MTQYKNSTVGNENLNKVPDFYRSVAGNPYADRLGNRSSKTGLLVRRSAVEMSKELEDSGFGTYIATFTITHNLGYKPYPMGQLTIGGSYFPLPYSDFTGNTQVTFTNIDNNKLELLVSSVGQAEAKIKIYLLREGLI